MRIPNITKRRCCSGLFAVLFAVFCITGCETRPVIPHHVAASKDPDCPEDLACTEEYKTISLTIFLADRQPAVLDSFRTVIAENGTPLLFSYSHAQTVESGNIYPVANDGNMAAVGKEGKEVIFTGYLDGKKVVNHHLKIGHDCCHIMLIEGETEITLKSK